MRVVKKFLLKQSQRCYSECLRTIYVSYLNNNRKTQIVAENLYRVIWICWIHLFLRNFDCGLQSTHTSVFMEWKTTTIAEKCASDCMESAQKFFVQDFSWADGDDDYRHGENYFGLLWVQCYFLPYRLLIDCHSADGRLRQASFLDLCDENLSVNEHPTSDVALSSRIVELHLAKNDRTNVPYIVGGGDDGSIAIWTAE